MQENNVALKITSIQVEYDLPRQDIWYKPEDMVKHPELGRLYLGIH